MTKHTRSIFPAPIRSRIIYWLLGILGTGFLSWYALFAKTSYVSTTEGDRMDKEIHEIKHDYYSKEEAEDLEDRVLLIENNIMHQTKQLDHIVDILEK